MKIDILNKNETILANCLPDWYPPSDECMPDNVCGPDHWYPPDNDCCPSEPCPTRSDKKYDLYFE